MRKRIHLGGPESYRLTALTEFSSSLKVKELRDSEASVVQDRSEPRTEGREILNDNLRQSEERREGMWEEFPFSFILSFTQAFRRLNGAHWFIILNSHVSLS